MKLLRLAILGVAFPLLAFCEFSQHTCDELGIDPAKTGLDDNVCGSAKPSGQCSTQQIYRDAQQFCEVAFMRLCTETELENDEAKTTGCGNSPQRVWSSDPCTVGGSDDVAHFSIAGSSNGISEFPSQCVFDTETIWSRCCGDVGKVPDPPVASGECHSGLCNVEIDAADDPWTTDKCTITVVDQNDEVLKTNDVFDLSAITSIPNLPTTGQLCFSVTCTNRIGESGPSQKFCDEFHNGEEPVEEIIETEPGDSDCPADPESVLFSLSFLNDEYITRSLSNITTNPSIMIVYENQSPTDQFPLTLSVATNQGKSISTESLGLGLNGDNFPFVFDSEQGHFQLLRPGSPVKKTLDVTRHTPTMERSFTVELELSSPCTENTEILILDISYTSTCPAARFSSGGKNWEVETFEDDFKITVVNDLWKTEPWKQGDVLNPLIDELKLQYRPSSEQEFINVPDDLIKVDKVVVSNKLARLQDENGESSFTFDMAGIKGGGYDLRLETKCTQEDDFGHLAGYSKVWPGARDSNVKDDTGDDLRDGKNGTITASNVDLTWFWLFLIMLGILFILVLCYHGWKKRQRKNRQELLLNGGDENSVILLTQ